MVPRHLLGLAMAPARRWVRSGGAAPPEPAVERAAGSGERVNVVWHKWSDLRLLDHEPLWHAHHRPEPVLHIHLVELPLLAGHSRVAGTPRCSSRRKEFWLQCVEETAEGFSQGPDGNTVLVIFCYKKDLAKNLKERGQHLVVEAVKDPAEFFANLCDRVSIRAVYAHQEFCDEELQTEAAVRRVLESHGATLETFWGALTVRGSVAGWWGC
eukprot:s1126_g7.t1